MICYIFYINYMIMCIQVEMLQRELESLHTENSAIREQLDSQKEMVETRSKKQTQQLKSQL